MSSEFDKHQYKMFYEASLKEIIRLIEQRDQAEAKVQKLNKIINYCIGKIHDDSALRYIERMCREAEQEAYNEQ